MASPQLAFRQRNRQSVCGNGFFNLEMDDLRRLHEILSHKGAPFLEIFGIAKMDSVIFKCVPDDEEMETARLLDALFQRHRPATRRTYCQRSSRR